MQARTFNQLSLILAIGLLTLSGIQPTAAQPQLENAVRLRVDSSMLAGTQANLSNDIVINGNFEIPDVESVQFDTYYAGQTFSNWTVESGSVDHISERYWQAANGRQSVDLDGTFTDGTPGTIYQDVSTSIGQTYQLRFALAGNPDGGPAVKQMQVWWGTTLVDTPTFDVTGQSRGSMGWVYREYTVTSSSAITRLKFKSLTPGFYGPVLDAVSVQNSSPSLPSLDLPIDYASLNLKFAEAALGNLVDPKTGKSGRVNSWYDHSFPTYCDSPNGNGYMPWPRNRDCVGPQNLTLWNGVPYLNASLSQCTLGVNCYDGHNGIDFQHNWNVPNEPVYAAAPGVVKEVYKTWSPQNSGARGSPYGNYVLIDHGGGYATFYAHLASVNNGIDVGIPITDVKAKPLGAMGGSGGWKVHLHFGVYYDPNEKWPDRTEVDPYDPSKYLWKEPIRDRKTGDASGTVLTTPSGRGKATIPPGALNSAVTLELWDVPPTAVPSAQLRLVGNAISLRVLEWLTGNRVQSVSATRGFSQTVNINMRYRVEDITHLDSNQLSMYRWNEVTQTWLPLTTTVNYNLNEATAQTTETGSFELQAPLLCPTDSSEIDDSYSTAKGIPQNGVPVNRLFDIAQDEDWFQLQAVSGGKYKIRTSNLATGVDTVVEVYDTNGLTLLASDDNNGGGQTSYLEWQAPQSGTYFIRVVRANGSAYGCNASYKLSVSQELRLFLPLLVR